MRFIYRYFPMCYDTKNRKANGTTVPYIMFR